MTNNKFDKNLKKEKKFIILGINSHYFSLFSHNSVNLNNEF